MCVGVHLATVYDSHGLLSTVIDVVVVSNPLPSTVNTFPPRMSINGHVYLVIYTPTLAKL